MKGGGGDSLEGRDYHPSSYYSDRGKSGLCDGEVIVSTDSYDTLNTAAFASQPGVNILQIKYLVKVSLFWYFGEEFLHVDKCF